MDTFWEPFNGKNLCTVNVVAFVFNPELTVEEFAITNG